MKTITEREQWFLDRVGKRVYIGKHNDNLEFNSDVIENGIAIKDAWDAMFLHAIEEDSDKIKVPLRFFDTPEERDVFELTLKK